jgi:hypothetical protein
LQRLRKAVNPATGSVFDENELPSEKRVKRFFSSLCQKKRAAGRDVVLC